MDCAGYIYNLELKIEFNSELIDDDKINEANETNNKIINSTDNNKINTDNTIVYNNNLEENFVCSNNKGLYYIDYKKKEKYRIVYKNSTYYYYKIYGSDILGCKALEYVDNLNVLKEKLNKNMEYKGYILVSDSQRKNLKKMWDNIENIKGNIKGNINENYESGNFQLEENKLENNKLEKNYKGVKKHKEFVTEFIENEVLNELNKNLNKFQQEKEYRKCVVNFRKLMDRKKILESNKRRYNENANMYMNMALSNKTYYEQTARELVEVNNNLKLIEEKYNEFVKAYK